MILKLYGYNEYEPSPNLKPYLDCYWSHFLDSSTISDKTSPIIPDGCIDIIFDLNCPASLDSFVVGAMTKPFFSNKTNLIGVRFKPGRAYPFLNIPVHKITDQMVEYHEFGGPTREFLSTQLAEINSTSKQISFINQVFSKKLIGLALINPQVSHAINLITQSCGKYNVNQLSNQVGWSRQHLTRECLKHIGISPKFLSQVVRVNNVINGYKTKTFHDWSQLSIDSGYYDQSHMINEFRTITGLTPTDYLIK